MYVGRVGVNVTKDIRVTVEGMLVNEKSLAWRRTSATRSGWARPWAPTSASSSLTARWSTASGSISRAAAAGRGNPFEESGFGAFVTAQIPVGPLNVFAVGWYTTGDDQVGPAG